jgi:hypothetical protein
MIITHSGSVIISPSGDTEAIYQPVNFELLALLQRQLILLVHPGFAGTKQEKKNAAL